MQPASAPETQSLTAAFHSGACDAYGACNCFEKRPAGMSARLPHLCRLDLSGVDKGKVRMNLGKKQRITPDPDLL